MFVKLEISSLPEMKGFPLQNLLPGRFIVSIVNFYDIVHIIRLNLVILPFPALAQHGVPKHLLGGVDPVLVLTRSPSGDA